MAAYLFVNSVQPGVMRIVDIKHIVPTHFLTHSMRPCNTKVTAV